jgi:hypothetical protein
MERGAVAAEVEEELGGAFDEAGHLAAAVAVDVSGGRGAGVEEGAALQGGIGGEAEQVEDGGGESISRAPGGGAYGAPAPGRAMTRGTTCSISAEQAAAHDR